MLVLVFSLCCAHLVSGLSGTYEGPAKTLTNPPYPNAACCGGTPVTPACAVGTHTEISITFFEEMGTSFANVSSGKSTDCKVECTYREIAPPPAPLDFNGTMDVLYPSNCLGEMGALRAEMNGDVLKGGFEVGYDGATAVCDCTFSFDELVKKS